MTRRRPLTEPEVEARIAEIEWHRGLPADFDPPQHHSVVSLTKRVRIDADWCRRNRLTDEQQQRLTDELRAAYGPDVRVLPIPGVTS